MRADRSDQTAEAKWRCSGMLKCPTAIVGATREGEDDSHDTGLQRVSRFDGVRRTPVPNSRRIVRQRPSARAAHRSAMELKALQTFRIVFGSARRYDVSVRRLSGIPGSLLWALSAIAHGEDMSVGGLSANMALHQTTASNLVNALVARGLIDRTRSDEDRRVARLSVTSKGRGVLQRAPRPHAGLLRDSLTRLDAKRLDRLLSGLTGLVAEMRITFRAAAGETLLGE